MRNSTGPWLLVIAAITIFVVFIVWPGTNRKLFDRTIDARLGLDIQGGLRVLLAAQSDTQVDSGRMAQVKTIIENRVNALGVSEPVVQVAGGNRVIVELPGITNSQDAINIVKQTALLEFVDFTNSCGQTFPAEKSYILTDKQIALRGATPTGTPTAITTGTPGTPAGLTPTVTKAAPLVFKQIQATQDATAALTATTAPTSAVTATAVPPTAVATANATAVATANGTAAATAAATASGTPAETAPGQKNNPLKSPCTGQPFHTVMTGDGLADASPQLSGSNSTQYVISFTLKGGAASQGFVDFTRTASARHDPLAIVLDGQVLSAPAVQAALTDSGVITGNFTLDSAKTLALQLKSGALPVSLTIESTEQVGASLGTQSIQASVRGGVLGVLIVLIFVLVYYRIPGVAAALALVLFAGINFALYKLIPVTLTLSAITGFLISIGTAVDGNILIFERIKEELRSGKPLVKAVDAGFTRAWPSIRDSNISTIMIGMILYFFGGQFGASAVRGFAVTLILGLVINLFTAVIVTHTFLNVIINLGGDRIRQMKIFGE